MDGITRKGKRKIFALIVPVVFGILCFTNGIKQDEVVLVFIFVFVISFFCFSMENSVNEEEDSKINLDIQNFCEVNCYNFIEKIDDFPAKGFFIVHRIFTSNNAYENVISGSKSGVPFEIFDYNFEVPGGKGGKGEFTLGFFKSDALNQATFGISNKNGIFDDLNSFLSNDIITFKEDSEFSKKFVLQSDDEVESIKKLFTQEVREAFVTNHDKLYRYKCIDNYLVIITEEKRFLEDRAKMLENGVKIIQAFEKNNN